MSTNISLTGGHKVSGVLLALSLVFCQMAPAQADVGIGVNIGVNMPAFPQMVAIPGYPVYYDPTASSNYFFYDGMYWVYDNDNWYASSWYNGPWELAAPDEVPLFVLRVPVSYYRHPPTYFSTWRADRAPHWDEHWGHDWGQRHTGWNQWNINDAPHAAPLPVYQQNYAGERYPHVATEQRNIRSQNYQYQPHDSLVQQRFQAAARDNGHDTGRDNDRGDRHEGRDQAHDQDHH